MFGPIIYLKMKNVGNGRKIFIKVRGTLPRQHYCDIYVYLNITINMNSHT